MVAGPENCKANKVQVSSDFFPTLAQKFQDSMILQFVLFYGNVWKSFSSVSTLVLIPNCQLFQDKTCLSYFNFLTA